MDLRLPIRSIDYTVIFARQMTIMREFYGTTLGFPYTGSSAPDGSSFGSVPTCWPSPNAAQGLMIHRLRSAPSRCSLRSELLHKR
jgi:hypothetical protein